LCNPEIIESFSEVFSDLIIAPRSYLAFYKSVLTQPATRASIQGRVSTLIDKSDKAATFPFDYHGRKSPGASA